MKGYDNTAGGAAVGVLHKVRKSSNMLIPQRAWVRFIGGARNKNGAKTNCPMTIDWAEKTRTWPHISFLY